MVNVEAGGFFGGGNKAYLSVAHDTANSICLQLLFVLWESQKCEGAVLSGSITNLLKSGIRSFAYTLEELYEVISVTAHRYLGHVHVCLQFTHDLRWARRT